MGDQRQQLEVSSILQLLKQSPRNAPIIVTGEAGSGKTTVLRHIVNSWLHPEEFPYEFVFHIPLGKSRSHNVPDIICQDLKLLPEECVDSLTQALAMQSKKVLFLLDSYEELHHETKALENLITGDLYPHATVVVTTRPGSRLTGITERMSTHIETQLQDFSEEEMTHYIQVYLSQNQQQEVKKVVDQFFGYDFLQRPFNVALACYLYGATASVELLGTQTVLLSRILQHTMQAYVKKKKGIDVPLTAGSPLENEHFPADTKTMLKEISRMCFHAFRGNQQWLYVKDNPVVTMQDLLDFRLFTSGPEPNSVSVPHSLFLEYLAAVYLVADKPTWEALYADVQRKSQSASPHLCLEDSVTPLENVIKFVVGLSPAFTTQLCNLLVIKQQRLSCLEGSMSECPQCDLEYEMTLLNECNDDSTKSAMATALLSAPVSAVHRSSTSAKNKWSHQLLHYFNEQECLSFSEKAYGCHCVGTHECKTLRLINPRKRYVWDDFPVQFVQKYSYSVQMEKLRIVGSALPVGRMSRRMAGVKTLILMKCTLCGTVADSRNKDGTVRLRSDGAAETPAGPCRLHLHNSVAGLNCLSEATLPGIGKLFVYREKCLDLGLLSCTFTELTQLAISYVGPVELSTANGYRKWDKLKRLQVKDTDDIPLSIIAKVCTQLDDLLIVDCKRVVLDTDGSVTRWPSVSRLVLQSSPVETTTGPHLTEGTARQRLSEMLPFAEIYIYGYNEQVQVVISRYICSLV